jgi:hypothetical protein
LRESSGVPLTISSGWRRNDESSGLEQDSILNKFIDERFLEHRRRSSSGAGITAACLAIALFEHRFFASHIWDWSLLSIGLTLVVIKLAMMTWYRIKD